MKRRLPLLLVAALGCAALVPGCEKGAKSDSPAAGPEAPQYESATEEVKDLPNRVQAQVEWAMAPITDAAALADEIAALQGKLSLDATAFTSMANAAFKDGTVSISADIEVDAEAKAELEAMLGKIKQVAADLKGIAGRVKTATGNIVKLGAKAPLIAGKAGRELKGELKAAVDAEAKLKIEADITGVKEIPGKMKTIVTDAKTSVMEIPKQAVEAGTKLAASFTGGGSIGGGGDDAGAEEETTEETTEETPAT